jgi:hypothetical protein
MIFQLKFGDYPRKKIFPDYLRKKIFPECLFESIIEKISLNLEGVPQLGVQFSFACQSVKTDQNFPYLDIFQLARALIFRNIPSFYVSDDFSGSFLYKL